jgi:drug/metabolite transporter (DMT)-like permease
VSTLALGIVLAAALLHAAWNLLAKKSRRKIVYIWWFLLVALIIYLPMAVYFWPAKAFSARGWICVVTTGILHALYFWCMGGAYERGDLSLVYPLARGFGPFLVPVLAVAFFDERLSALGISGIVQVITGIYVIHLNSFSIRSAWKFFAAAKGGATWWALGTGGTIAAYSLVDKVGVGFVYPPVYIYLMFVITFVLLSALVVTTERCALATEWRTNKVSIVSAGVLVLLTYMLVLFAFRLSNVSYVVAAREVSIVFSSVFGILWLKEAHAIPRIVGAALIASGVVCIGLSH